MDPTNNLPSHLEELKTEFENLNLRAVTARA